MCVMLVINMLTTAKQSETQQFIRTDFIHNVVGINPSSGDNKPLYIMYILYMYMIYMCGVCLLMFYKQTVTYKMCL